MYGIDIGISVSSISCITKDGLILDTHILFGDKHEVDEWKRIVEMADSIVDAVHVIERRNIGFVAPLVSIEEPVYPYRTRNPRSYFNMCCLYAILRKKFQSRRYHVFSVNPVTAKATAKAIFKGKRLSSTYMQSGRLTKKGMIRAYKKVFKKEPPYSNAVGRETLADSYWIARTGNDILKIGLQRVG